MLLFSLPFQILPILSQQGVECSVNGVESCVFTMDSNGLLPANYLVDFKVNSFQHKFSFTVSPRCRHIADFDENGVGEAIGGDLDLLGCLLGDQGGVDSTRTVPFPLSWIWGVSAVHDRLSNVIILQEFLLSKNAT